MSVFAEFLAAAQQPLAFLALFTFLFVAGKEIAGLLARYDLAVEIGKNKNVALALSATGYYLGFIVVFLGALPQTTREPARDVLSTAGYVAVGMVFLLFTQWVVDRLLLPGLSAGVELKENQNTAVGIVMLGAYLATGLIVAGSIYGKQIAPTAALAFYAIGQLSLVVCVRLYDWATPFWLPGHIEEGNLAVGIGLSGSLVAIGLLVMNAVMGGFVGWIPGLQRLGGNLLVVLIHLAGLRVFFHIEFIPVDELYLAITRDQNVGAGLLQFAVSVGFAGVLVVVL